MSAVRRGIYRLASMAAKRKPRRRQFVVRLDQDGGDDLYSRLLNRSLKLSRSEGRRVPMTEIARRAIEAYL